MCKRVLMYNQYFQFTNHFNKLRIVKLESNSSHFHHKSFCVKVEYKYLSALVICMADKCLEKLYYFA